MATASKQPTAVAPHPPDPATTKEPRRRVKTPAALADIDRPMGDTTLWQEIGRLLVLIAAALMLVLIVRGGNIVHTSALNLFGWSAYIAPVVVAVIGLDVLRRRSGELPLLRFEETNGIILLFAALDVALAGIAQQGGYLGATLASGLLSLGGRQVLAIGIIGLVALGGVLTFHWSTQQFVWLVLLVLRAVGHGISRGLRLLWRIVVGVLHALVRALHWLMTRRRARQEFLAQSSAAPAIAPPQPTPTTGIRRRVVPTLLAAPGAQVSSGAGTSQATMTQPSVADSTQSAPPPAGPLATVRAALVKPTLKPAPVVDASQAPVVATTAAPAPPQPAAQPAQTSPTLWPRPSLDLLDPVVVGSAGPVDIELRKQIIEDTLLSFNVKAAVVGAHIGPTVTQFDLQPDRGVRVQRITALANDLALALASPGSIRIEAPVPGQPVVGLQVPNTSTSMVSLREMLQSDAFADGHTPLTVALGKDVAGKSVVADLAKMPHLLIAGATGSGKSVCLNSVIACLLFHNSPDRLRLLMVDPKMVELTPFDGVPHLLAPVVTDVEKVPNTLKWAIREMKDRYTKFTAAGVRNVLRYNEIQTDEAQRLPYIVIIIDELADLMMVAPEEVEGYICRLAQLARATGIHLVIATQRPSVDVITGLIKANFPSRIAFAVSSQVDSRTIMDMAGAEKLMGRGDMLYMAPDASKPLRVQGAFLSDKEIETLVNFWKYNAPAAPSQISADDLDAAKVDPEESAAEEKIVEEATRVVREYNRASVSLLQRRLSIGYSRAARLLDLLEERGVVGPSHDGRSRIVILMPTDVDGSGGRIGSADDGMDDDEPPF